MLQSKTTLGAGTVPSGRSGAASLGSAVLTAGAPASALGGRPGPTSGGWLGIECGGVRRGEPSMTRIGSFILLAVWLLMCPGARAADDGYFPKPDSEGGWRAVRDAAQAREAAGVDVARL